MRRISAIFPIKYSRYFNTHKLVILSVPSMISELLKNILVLSITTSVVLSIISKIVFAALVATFGRLHAYPRLSY